MWKHSRCSNSVAKFARAFKGGVRMYIYDHDTCVQACLHSRVCASMSVCCYACTHHCCQGAVVLLEAVGSPPLPCSSRDS